VTLEKVPGVIVDYSNREQNEFHLTKEIEKSSVICLVYSMSDELSKSMLSSYWLPKINEIEESLSNNKNDSVANYLNDSLSFPSTPTTPLSPRVEHVSLIQNNANKNIHKRPIIIVANKCDENNEANNNLTNDPLISNLIVSNPQIETCIQCSAKTLKNVPEVFYYAQKSVLYPTAPVYDVDNKKLTQQAIKCLTRIFKLCDYDNDGILNDKELNEFQLKCFGVRLNSASLQEVKSLLSTTVENKNENLINNEITLNGFLYLNALFFKKGRHETSWTVLKKFGYDRNLSISREYASIK
jgi:mitochondrial Rho GTPase 1